MLQSSANWLFSCKQSAWIPPGTSPSSLYCYIVSLPIFWINYKITTNIIYQIPYFAVCKTCYTGGDLFSTWRNWLGCPNFVGLVRAPNHHFLEFADYRAVDSGRWWNEMELVVSTHVPQLDVRPASLLRIELQDANTDLLRDYRNTSINMQ